MNIHSSRTDLIERIDDEHAKWNALLAEIDPASMDTPHVVGEWSFKDVVAHLTAWRQPYLDDYAEALGAPPPPPSAWPYAFAETDENLPDGESKVETVNEWIYARNHNHPVDIVLAESQRQWEQLRQIVTDMPEAMLNDPQAFPKLGGKSLAHAIMSGDQFSHFHHEHEPVIRAWISGREISEDLGSTA